MRLRMRVLLGAIALFIVILVAVLWPREQVTEDNFRRIQIGMIESELLRLLGPPDGTQAELGLVEGPETYIINFSQTDEEKRRRGFERYRHLQWNSRELRASVICDLEGQVVCRYSSPPPRSSRSVLHRWLFRLGFSQD